MYWLSDYLFVCPFAFYLYVFMYLFVCMFVYLFVNMFAHFSVVSMENRRCKLIRDVVLAEKYNPQQLFRLLLNTGQFEFVLKEVVGS